jgi:cobalt/nickel transport system ATP-binding protein
MEVTKKNLKDIRRNIGYTFQDPDNQLFMPSVYDDVAFGPRQEGKSEKEVHVIVEKALGEVGGNHLATKASYKLSGGEKRIVALATVLATQPNVLILDEPSVGLDPRSRRQLIRLVEQRKETKIITTHDMDMALELCDRIIVLYKGEVQADDTPMNIFRNRQLLCDNYLELPLQLQGCPLCGEVLSTI